MKKVIYRTPKIISNKIPSMLPWINFTSNGKIVTKTGLLLAFYKIFPTGDYYDGDEDEKAVSAFNRILMNLPDETVVWYEFAKEKPLESQYNISDSKFALPSEILFEKAREEAFSKNLYGFTNSRYFCIGYHPSISSSKGIMKESEEAFEKILKEMEQIFSSADIDAIAMNRDDICTYLHSCISSKKYPITEPSSSSHGLSDSLWDDYLDFDSIPLRLGEDFIKVIAIDDFPLRGTKPEMLSSLLNISGSFRWVTRFITKSSEESMKIIDKKKATFRSKRFGARDIAASVFFKSDTEGKENRRELNKADECDEAMEICGTEVNFGFFTGLFVIEASTEKEVNKISDQICRILAKHQFVYRDEILNLVGAWTSSIPGNAEANPRKPFISTGNIGCCISLSDEYRGERENKLFKEISGIGSPNAVALLSNGNIYNLNLNGKSDVGNTFIVGPAGSGKSVLLSFLGASFRKYPKSQVIFFDKGGSSIPFVKSNGGSIFYPGKDETSFQPLKDASHHLDRCRRFLKSIANVHGITLSPSELNDISSSLSLMENGFETLSIFKELLEGHDHDSDLVAILNDYIKGGTYGNLFDADHDSLDANKWPSMTTIEMGTLMNMGDEAIMPALTYIMSQIFELIEDRAPRLLIIDEAWVFMKHPFMADFIIECLKTFRKYHCFIVLATQELDDYNSVIRSILTNCHTKIMLPNTNAISEKLLQSYLDIGLDLNDIAVISDPVKMRDKRNYYVIQPEGNAVIDLCLDEKQVQILTQGAL